MTETEAIKNLEDIKRMYTWSTGADDALDMAIEALKKQIPKKPGEKELSAEQPFENHSVYIIPCGNCGESLNFLHSFCPWCGQAILWEDGES